MLHNEDVAKEWINVANLDLKSAKFLMNMKDIPFQIVCYHCQQAIEKYLKAYLAFCGNEIIKTHDLLILNKKCEKYNKIFKEIYKECLDTNDYAVHTRYPFYEELNESDAIIAIKNAERVKGFVEDIIK